MLGFYNYKNYTGMLNNFLDVVENDTSSILYHTRVFDDFMLKGILDYYKCHDVEVIPHYLFCNELELIIYYSSYSGFFFTIYKDFFLELINTINLLFNDFMGISYNDSISNYFFYDFLFFIENDISFYTFYNYLFFFQKNDLFGIINYKINLFFDFLFFFDFFLIICELLLILTLFLLLFNKISNFFLTTKFYDNILNFFKYNNISFLEISITCTLFISFYIFDIFLSFSEDDFSDTLFYLILLFIFLMFFFLSIAIDIQYFYSMSNVSNGDVSLRLLFFDILNNFLGVLRIFLC